MIKFRYLIHKETGTVIDYEEWLKEAKPNGFITINKERKVFVNPKNIFKARDVIFSDDFTIVYDSEFTTEQLKDIYRGMNNKTLCGKTFEILTYRENLEFQYNIDL